MSNAKTLRIKLLAAAGALLAIAIAVGTCLIALKPHPAPDIAFTSIKGEQIRLQQWRGKVVLVEFWATTCVYCVRDMPKIIDIYRELGGQGLQMIAISMSYDRPDYVVNYAESRKLPFPVTLDLQGDFAQAFGEVALTPTLFVIGKNGNIVKRYQGEPDFAALRQLLQVQLALAG